MNFEQIVQKIVEALRLRQSQVGQRQGDLARQQLQEQSLRQGFGGIPLSQAGALERAIANSVLSGQQEADIFGAQQRLGEAANVTAFQRQRQLLEEDFGRNLQLANMAAKAARTRAIIGALGGVAGAGLGAALSRPQQGG